MESMKILPSDSPKYDVLKVIFNNLCSFSFVFAGSMLSNFQKFYTNMFKSIKIELIKIQLLYLPFFSLEHVELRILIEEEKSHT